MNIGILTFHRAENFGAALQVYALSEYLKSIGHVPTVIDYRCKPIEHQYDIYSPYIFLSSKNIFKTLSKYLNRIKQAKFRKNKKKLFHEFCNEYLNLTCPIDNITSDLGFDAYITGSDQVWRLTITGGINSHYFLNFPMREDAKKISYAASSEMSDFKNLREEKAKIASLLKSFHAISVRESSFKEELEQYVDNEISTCVDPTFLLPSEYYKKLAILPSYNDYILVYHLFYSEDSFEVAKMIQQKSGKQIVEVFAGGIPKKKHADHIQIEAFGPREMLGLILNADSVITTSFHGLALSLILEKKVWVVNKGSNARLINLLNTFNLKDRFITDVSLFSGSTEIDYNSVKPLMWEQIEESKKFLNNALLK